jgi:hypothetical protein
LTLAIRRIVREEGEKRAEAMTAVTRPASTERESVAITLLIVNLLLIYSYIPLSKDLLDFAKFLAAGLGGGLAIANPGAARRWLQRWTSRRAFIPSNVVLLVLLMGTRFGQLPLRFSLDPATAVVIVDDDSDHSYRSGERVWLTVAEHKLKLHPGNGDIIVGDDQTKIDDRELKIHWMDVLMDAWPWAGPEHLGLLSPVSISFDVKAAYRVSLHSQAGFDVAFRKSSTRLSFRPPKDASIDVNSDQVSFQLPFGRYAVVAADRDGRKTCRCTTEDGNLVVDGHRNSANFECGP